MTILEILDTVEARISVLRSRQMPGAPPAPVAAEAAVALRAELEAAGISVIEFARAACVPIHDVEAWAAGLGPAPEWVPAAIRLIALLTPSARRKLLYGRAGAQMRTPNSHPFARIEEL